MAVLGNRIKTFRKKADLTQQEIAEQSNIPLMSYQRYERGERVPKKLKTLTAIALVLNISVDELLGITSRTAYREYTVLEDCELVDYLINVLLSNNVKSAEGFEKFFELNNKGRKELGRYLNYLLQQEECRINEKED